MLFSFVGWSRVVAGEKVLVVEDEKDILDMISIILVRAGYTASMASSICDAQATLAGGKYDLLLSDHFLPDGLGSDLLRQVHSDPRNLKMHTVLMSAAADMHAWDGELIADAILSKPFALQDLCLLVRNLLDSPPNFRRFSNCRVVQDRAPCIHPGCLVLRPFCR